MVKEDKKKAKLLSRLIELEKEMATALSKKSSGTSDILNGYIKKIEQVKTQLAGL